MLLAWSLLALLTPSFDVQGHRGARGLAPENTLAGFAAALEIGVTTLELDVGITKDGVVVVSHDSVLNPDLTRDASGAWLLGMGPRIHELTLEQLRRFDVGRLRPGSAYAESLPEQRGVDGESVPTLAQVIALATQRADREVRFNVETKIDPRFPGRTPDPESFVEAVVRELRANDAADRATLQSFDWRTLVHAREIAPEIARSCLTIQRPAEDNVQVGQAGAPTTLAGLDVDDYGGSVPRVVEAAGCAFWSPYFLDLDAARLEEAHALGLRVIVWTVNASSEMERLLGLGVDGIITDRPDLLRKVMAAHGLPLPPSR